MFLIGSGALECNPILNWREPKDIDYLATEQEYQIYKEKNSHLFVHEKKTRWGYALFLQGHLPIEFEIAKDGNLTEQLIEIIKENRKHTMGIVHPQVVYTMKMSHRYLRNSPHFKKSMDDILKLREYGFGSIPECLQDWYKARMKATYDYGHPSLKQSKADFFSDDGINYIYDHDTIHETVKLFDRPAYEMIKDDAAEVFCSKAKFMSAPEDLKLATVLEETYTLALERSQIPFNFEPEPKKSFLKSLEKVCTSITSGWWREYAWENYYEVLSRYDNDYIVRFKHGLAQGVVKPYGTL